MVSLCCGCLLPHVTQRLVGFCHIMYQPTSLARTSKAPQAKFPAGGGLLSLSEELDGQLRYGTYAHNPKSAMDAPDFSFLLVDIARWFAGAIPVQDLDIFVLKRSEFHD